MKKSELDPTGENVRETGETVERMFVKEFVKLRPTFLPGEKTDRMSEEYRGMKNHEKIETENLSFC